MMYEAYWKRVGEIFAEDPGMVAHTERVLALARHIAREMAIPEREQRIVELSALLHDVGIVAAQRKYGSREGKYQHLEGPPVARKILEGMGEEREIATFRQSMEWTFRFSLRLTFSSTQRRGR
jgi:hypothetical protein